MNDRIKDLAGKFSSVATAGLSPVLLLIMGYISNVLLMVYNSSSNAVVVRIVRILSFGVGEFEPELRDAVIRSATPYDDKLVDELLEVIDEVLAEPE